MAFPVLTFPNFAALETYINTEWIPNGNQDITGEIGNNVENGLLTFIKQSSLNWAKASVVSGGGAVSPTAPVNIYTTTTPSSLTWTDNIYHEYIFINMTAAAIPITSPLVYYDMNGTPHSTIPANTSVNIVKATNDLWVATSIISGSGGGGGGGTSQKAPNTYKVGTTPGAPTAGANFWTNAAFANSYVVITLNRSVTFDLIDVGEGAPYVSKTLSSTTVDINNYTWNTGDILTYILITP
jgi:hypothetical protein